MNVNWIDLVFLCLFIYGSFSGFKKGLIREVASLASLFISIISVYYFSNQLSILIENILNISTGVAYVISCLIIFLTTIYLVSYFAKLITKAVNVAPIGIINRIAGFIFGLSKWVVISSCLIFITIKIFFSNEISKQLKIDLMENSLILEPLSGIGSFIFSKINRTSIEEEWKYL